MLLAPMFPGIWSEKGFGQLMVRVGPIVKLENWIFIICCEICESRSIFCESAWTHRENIFKSTSFHSCYCFNGFETGSNWISRWNNRFWRSTQLHCETNLLKLGILPLQSIDETRC